MSNDKYIPHPGLCGRLRNELLDGPVTSNELASLVDDIPKRTVQVGLWILLYTKQARVAGTVPINPAPVRGRRTLKLYELTPRGRYLAKKESRPIPQ